MADLSGARAQSCRRSWILRKPADTTSQHSTTMAATAESASAYNWDGRPNRGRSHLFSSLVRRKWIQELISSCSPIEIPERSRSRDILHGGIAMFSRMKKLSFVLLLI